MHRKLALLVLSVLVLMVPSLPAQAITDGQPDGGAHPYVGELLFFDPTYHDSRFIDPGGWFTCSGTLIDSTHVVTAGHCTYMVGEGYDKPPNLGVDGKTVPGSGGTDVWFSTLEEPDFSILPSSYDFADADGYDGSGGNLARFLAWEAALDGDSSWVRATSFPFPKFYSSAFVYNDVGVLALHAPMPKAHYGELPSAGLVDELYAANHQATYTPVGYGLEVSTPHYGLGGDNRRVATVKINNLKGVYGLGKGIAVGYSSNKGKPHTGGTCFGDSGGPTFPDASGYQNTIITVTSFGIDPNCSAGGGGFRLDQPRILDWIGEAQAYSAS
jgi:hypothetical protein